MPRIRSSTSSTIFPPSRALSAALLAELAAVFECSETSRTVAAI